MTETDEVTMYLILRADLKMTKGKIAAQAGHAVQLAIRETERTAKLTATLQRFDLDDGAWLRAWEAGSYPKVVLRADSEAQLVAVHARLTEARVIAARVVDEGRTEIPPGTVTALGVQPMPRSLIQPLVADLRLL